VVKIIQFISKAKTFAACGKYKEEKSLSSKETELKTCTECGKNFYIKELPRQRGVFKCPYCQAILCPNCLGGLKKLLGAKELICPHCHARLAVKYRAAGKKFANGTPVNGVHLLRVPIEGKLII